MVVSDRDSFIFYPSWLDIIEAYEKSGQQEMAKELALQIVKYGVTGEISTDNPIIAGTINAMCKDLVEKSKVRYKSCIDNGKRGGRPKKYDDEEIIRLHNLGLSNQDIADNLLCSIKTVVRAIKNYEDDEI